jgi:predicted ArsR family transcriptional regulator
MKNINDALGSLVESGEITRTVVPTTGPGRPPELYALAEDGEE